MRPRFNGLWRHQDFVRLWTGETISVFGSLIGQLAMQFTAIIWLDASALQISALAMAQLVPGFFVGIAAGVWADRLPRRPIMIAADVGRAALIASVPLSAVFGVLTMGQLYAVAAGASALTVCFNVAYEAYLPTLVSASELVEGNAKLQASASVAEVGSFGLSGWLVQALSGPGALLIDAVSFVASAVFVGRIRSPEPARVREQQASFWREAHDGVRLVAGDRLLRSFAAVNAMREFSSRIFGTVLLLYLYREVGFGAGVLGVIFAVGGGTSLIGAYLAPRAANIGVGRALVAALIVQATGSLFTPLAASVSAIAVGYLVLTQVVTDPAWIFYDINELSLRQAITPDALQGRMNATIRVGGFAAMLAGTAAAGVLGEWIGLRETLFIAVAGNYAAALLL
ncbi:MAG TPA: MFS transporter, partial [Vicinamibacterales bacterium]|nr:MFS transporter [Vicinamibacterales bacterium]